MIENLECRRFRNRLDAYVDGELSASEREEMRRHAQSCEDCATLLAQYEDMLRALSTLDEGIEIPAEAAQAWRSLVRDEAERDRRHSGRGWIRALSSFAAAFVVLLGLTGLYRSNFPRMATENSRGLPTTETTSYSMASPMLADTSAMDLGYANETSGAGVLPAMTAKSTVLSHDGPLSDTLQVQREDDDRKPVVLRTASRSMQSLSFDEDMASIDAIVDLYGGWFSYRALSGRTWEEGGSGRTLDANVRIPTDVMDDFLTDLSQVGATLRMTDSAEDVSATYYDTQARLEGLLTQRDRLNELVTTAADLSDLLALEDKLYQVQSEIDALEGALKDVRSRAQYSQIDIFVSEVREYTEPEFEEKTLMERIREGFRDSIDWVRSFCQDMLVAVVTFSPSLIVIIPAVLIIILVIRSIRRRRR